MGHRSHKMILCGPPRYLQNPYCFGLMQRISSAILSQAKLTSPFSATISSGMGYAPLCPLSLQGFKFTCAKTTHLAGGHNELLFFSERDEDGGLIAPEENKKENKRKTEKNKTWEAGSKFGGYQKPGDKLSWMEGQIIEWGHGAPRVGQLSARPRVGWPLGPGELGHWIHCHGCSLMALAFLSVWTEGGPGPYFWN